MVSMALKQVSFTACSASHSRVAPSARGSQTFAVRPVVAGSQRHVRRSATLKFAPGKTASDFYGQTANFQTRNVCKKASVSGTITCSTADAKTVAVTGASGFVGSALVKHLSQQGYKVKVLARSASSRYSMPYTGVEIVQFRDWERAICGCSAVVNLAGEPISTRWTPGIKREIMDSRLRVTDRLAAAINACSEETRPAVFVSASALGFYGASETGSFDETSGPGNDYLAKVCIGWEKSAKAAQTSRTVILRLGIVLAKEGGALAKMLPIFQLGAGGPLGTGNQWFSWVHMDDVIGLIMEALTSTSMEGVYNATAPKPVRMNAMCKALGNAVARPSWLPVPEFALQAILGEGASVVLEGQQVLPKRTMESGYKHKYATIDQAVRAILK